MIIFVIGSSCKKTYTPEDCQELAFKAFKGSPRSANLLDNNCKEKELKYPRSWCQKVLTEFIILGDINQLTQKYGNSVLNCLSENDRKTFNKSSKK